MLTECKMQNITEHSYTITTSNTYTFNAYSIERINVNNDTTVTVEVKLYNKNADTPMLLLFPIDTRQFTLTQEQYQDMKPSDLYIYVAEQLLLL